MYVMSFRCCRNDSGVSATTCSTRMRVCPGVSFQSYKEGWRNATRTHFEVLDEALEEGDEVLRFADVARDGLREQVLRQHCGCGEMCRCV